MAMVPVWVLCDKWSANGTFTFPPMDAGMTQGSAIVQIWPGFAGRPVPAGENLESRGFGDSLVH